MAEVTTQDQIPSYQEKLFVELSDPGMFDYLSSQVPSNQRGRTIQDVARGSPGVGGDARNIIKSLNDRGLGNVQIGDLLANKNNVDFIERYGLGKSYSYEDLALEALSADPNFNPEDRDAVTSFAQDLEKRGLKNTDREKIASLATSNTIGNAIDRATNPGKYLTEDERNSNTENAKRLIQTAFGEDYNDPDMQEFVGDLLSQGTKPYEVGQFLQTTTPYLERKAAKDREAINQELLASEEEVFRKAQPQIIASYMRAGRLNSSGVDSALAKARAELASQRQNMLTGYAREDVVGARNAAFQNYLRQSEPAYQQQFNIQNASNYMNYQQPYNNLNRTYQLADESRARRYAQEDYARQQSDFMRYLNSQGGSAGAGALRGALSGAGAGASFGPWGALIGAGVGAAGGYAAYR